LHDIRIWGRGGNDHVHFGGGFDGLSLFVHGGAGDDSIEQDHMASVLIGGDGKDKLTAGDRNDVLIGSAGADNLNAGKGNDVLIGGLPSPKLTLTALRQAGSAWASTHTSQLTKIAPVQDTEADTFTGGSGLDWFVENLADKITDLQATKDLVTKV
jgi:Ca2+-binding RTX toxin-like protein